MHAISRGNCWCRDGKTQVWIWLCHFLACDLAPDMPLFTWDEYYLLCVKGIVMRINERNDFFLVKCLVHKHWISILYFLWINTFYLLIIPWTPRFMVFCLARLFKAIFLPSICTLFSLHFPSKRCLSIIETLVCLWIIYEALFSISNPDAFLWMSHHVQWQGGRLKKSSCVKRSCRSQHCPGDKQITRVV